MHLSRYATSSTPSFPTCNTAKLLLLRLHSPLSRGVVKAWVSTLSSLPSPDYHPRAHSAPYLVVVHPPPPPLPWLGTPMFFLPLSDGSPTPALSSRPPVQEPGRSAATGSPVSTGSAVLSRTRVADDITCSGIRGQRRSGKSPCGCPGGRHWQILVPVLSLVTVRLTHIPGASGQAVVLRDMEEAASLFDMARQLGCVFGHTREVDVGHCGPQGCDAPVGPLAVPARAALALCSACKQVNGHSERGV